MKFNSIEQLSTNAKTGDRASTPINNKRMQEQDGSTGHRNILSNLARVLGSSDKYTEVKLTLPKIRLYNKTEQNQMREFPVYPETSYLQLSKSLQAMLHKSTNDDDCETGEIQAKRASDYCRRESEEGIEEKFKDAQFQQESPEVLDMWSQNEHYVEHLENSPQADSSDNQTSEEMTESDLSSQQATTKKHPL